MKANDNMASMKKIIEIIAMIKTVYPYYSKDADVKVLSKTWDLLLKNYPDEVVDVALIKCLQICKQPPTPADIIEQIDMIYTVNQASEEELWLIYRNAIQLTAKYVYRIKYPVFGEDPFKEIEKIWNGLPAEIKRYLGSLSELKRISGSLEEELTFEKTRFMKAVPTMRKREEYAQLSEAITGEIGFEKIPGYLEMKAQLGM